MTSASWVPGRTGLFWHVGLQHLQSAREFPSDMGSNRTSRRPCDITSSRSVSPSIVSALLVRDSSVTSSTRCTIKSIRPSEPNTGAFTGDQYRSSKPPPSRDGRRIAYFCTAIVSGRPPARTRLRDERRFAVPVAPGSSGLSGKISKSGRPTIASRSV